MKQQFLRLPWVTRKNLHRSEVNYAILSRIVFTISAEVTLAIGNSAQVQTAQGVAVTQVQNLAVGSAAQVQTAQGVAEKSVCRGGCGNLCWASANRTEGQDDGIDSETETRK